MNTLMYIGLNTTSHDFKMIFLEKCEILLWEDFMNSVFYIYFLSFDSILGIFVTYFMRITYLMYCIKEPKLLQMYLVCSTHSSQ